MKTFSYIGEYPATMMMMVIIDHVKIFIFIEYFDIFNVLLWGHITLVSMIWMEMKEKEFCGNFNENSWCAGLWLVVDYSVGTDNVDVKRTQSRLDSTLRSRFVILVVCNPWIAADFVQSFNVLFF